MPRKPRWTQVNSAEHGLLTVELSSWKYFHDYVRQRTLPYSHFVWRGQRDSSWKLETTLDRQLKGKPRNSRERLVESHLQEFKYGSRGRRAPQAAAIADENDWWALGQHNGLSTPLLDWTESPFVALYFAFEKAEKPPSGFRSVWALGYVERINHAVRTAHAGDDRPPILEYIRPFQEDNSRLVNQSGLFTRVPLGTTVDDWVTSNFAGTPGNYALLQMRIPDQERLDCLRTLNRMNINHKTLFQDLYGSAEHCNKKLDIARY